MYEYLEVTIPSDEYFDEVEGRFKTIKGQNIKLKHSLVSISKWESKWHKPFLYTNDKSGEEMLDYIRCMTVTQNVDPSLYYFIPELEIKRIQEYINDPMTATTVNSKRKEGSSNHRDIVTSEVIYYQMIELGIPLECEKWHLNRLLMLIKVCNEKNTPGKKMTQRDILSQYGSLNKLRRARTGSRG